MCGRRALIRLPHPFRDYLARGSVIDGFQDQLVPLGMDKQLPILAGEFDPFIALCGQLGTNPAFDVIGTSSTSSTDSQTQH